MSEVVIEKALSVEKADSKLGVIVFKCLATHQDVEDADGDIVDPISLEKAFYEFMERREATPVDIDHVSDVEGSIVAGWYFPDENVYRVAFRPKDPTIIEKAEAGEFVGSSFSGSGTRESL